MRGDDDGDDGSSSLDAKPQFMIRVGGAVGKTMRAEGTVQGGIQPASPALTRAHPPQMLPACFIRGGPYDGN